MRSLGESTQVRVENQSLISGLPTKASKFLYL